MSNTKERILSSSVLGTSSNLMGICFVILSYIKVNGKGDLTRLDEFLGLPIILFFSAVIFSYLAIRSVDTPNSERLERYADYSFISALFFLAIASFVLVFEIAF